MSREYTAKEVRAKFLESIRNSVHYWSRIAESQDEYERAEGLAFSILNIIDGCADMPRLDMVVKPHPDDKQYHIDVGENYYPDGVVINETMLHEEFLK